MSAACASLPGANEPERAERGHELRAVDQREPLLRREHDRLEADGGERVGARQPLSVDPGLALADERQRQVGERREVARRPDRAAGGHVRDDAAVQALEQELDRLDPRARVALGKRVRAQQHRRADDLVGIGRADAARVAAQEAQLQLGRLLLGDRLRDEAAEPGVDAVGVLAGAEGGTLDECAGGAHLRPRLVGELGRVPLDRDGPDVPCAEVVAGEPDHGPLRHRPPSLGRAGVAPERASGRARAGGARARRRRRLRPRERGRRARSRRPPPRAPLPRRRSARPPRASGAACQSSMFMLTCTSPALGSSSPSARTPGKPPPRSRTTAAISRAASSVPRRLTLNATSGRLAPTRTHPAAGSSLAGTEVRPRARPRRAGAGARRARRGGRRQGRDRGPARRRERRAARARRPAPRARAPPPSRAPCPRARPARAGRCRAHRPAGARPRGARRSIRSRAHAIPASSDSTSSSSEPTSVNTERLWSGSVWTSSSRARSPNAVASAAIVSGSRPSETFGTDSSGSGIGLI